MTLQIPLGSLDLDKSSLIHLQLTDAELSKAREEQGQARLALAAPVTSGVTFSTGGWDTVFAIRISDVNHAIAANAVSPTTWRARVEASDFGPQIDATGTFGTWSAAVGGGSGTNLRMHLPFDATVTVNGKDHPVKGGVAYVVVHLIFLPDPGTQGSGSKDLVVRTTDRGPDNPVVEVSSVTYTSPARDENLDRALKDVLTVWCDANIAEFKHVFATVDIGRIEGEGDFSWLAPTYTAYAYADGPTPDDALLGVLCMTDGRDIAGKVEGLESGALPEGARAGFSISAERFLEKMVLSGIQSHFPKASPKTFQVTNNNTQIVATDTVKLDPVRVGLVDYHPEMTTFQVTVSGTEIEIYAYVHTNISPGIDAYAEVTHYATLKLGTKADGTQSLTFVETREPKKNGWSTVAPWVEGLEISADVILAVVSAIASNVATAGRRLVIRVVIAIVAAGLIGTIAAVLEKIPEWIAGDVPDALPSIDPLVESATRPFRWPNAKKKFVLTAVGLNGALQLSINPGFPDA
ncbi:TULIP family P47-like protein [Microbispora sp. CA-102843]|uniref:TULIP family P47-like protein n=1 Tax=Microbispora sp. CA-102843 TaxID=3239952 RepID=UPI003D91ECCD